MTCNKCNNAGWICERCGVQYESCDHKSAAGQACECNPDGNYDFAEIIADVSDSCIENPKTYTYHH